MLVFFESKGELMPLIHEELCSLICPPKTTLTLKAFFEEIEIIL